MMLSVIPSERYSAFGSSLALTSGRIASEFMALRDRALPDGCVVRPEFEEVLPDFLAVTLPECESGCCWAAGAPTSLPGDGDGDGKPSGAARSISRLNRFRSI